MRLTVSDPSAEQEMAEAIEELQYSWKRFKEMDKRPNAPHHPAHRIEWWRAVDALGIADGRCREAFCGRDRSPANIQLFAKWRDHWLTGIGGPYYEPNA